MQAGLSTKNAPSVWVVAPHFLVGSISLLIASIIMLFNVDDITGYHISGSILAITHLMILGWVSMIIFGALYQLIPVVMEVKLFSEKLAYISLVALSSGLVFLVLGFLGYRFQLSLNFILGGSLIILAVLVFIVNAIMSAIKSKKKSISKTFIITSTIYLLVVVGFGFVILLNFKYNFWAIAHTDLLKIHAMAGLCGWFIMLIIGVASKLLPMFLIVNKTNEKLLKASFWLLNAGIITYIIHVLVLNSESIAGIVSLLFIILALVLFFFYNIDIFKKRIRKKLDIGMKITALGLIMFALSVISFMLVWIGNSYFGLSEGRLEIISGFILIYGFFTGLILGQTYKTLPFIIWLYHYQPLVGKQKTPLPADLYSEKLANIHMLSFYASVLFTITGLIFGNTTILTTGIILIVLTVIVYSINVFKMIFHKTK